MFNQIPVGLFDEFLKGLNLIYHDRLLGVLLLDYIDRSEQNGEFTLKIIIVLKGFEDYSAEVERTKNLISSLSLKFGVSINQIFV
jgi:hypothetical protein